MKLENVKGYSIVLFIAICSVTFFISETNILETFVPRSIAMLGNKKLIYLHIVADFGRGVANGVLSVCLIKLHFKYKGTGLSITNFYLLFALWMGSESVVRFLQILHMYTSYYWIDGIVKLLTAWYSAIIAYVFVSNLPLLMSRPTPTELKELQETLIKFMNMLKKDERNAT